MILSRALLLLTALVWLTGTATAEWRHAMAMHGDPLYPADFKHYAYVNPGAPKGGKLRISTHRNFDSTNPLIVKGVGVPGVRLWTLESLMARGHDEAFTLYGLLAEAVDLPDDRSWVAFRLRKEAKFADGKPVTVEDVIFSLETLRDKARPNFGTYYSKVTKIERLGEREIKLHFASDADREIPLIMGLMPILPKHAFEARDFARTSLEPFPGSGPYEMTSVDAGKSITYRRRADYWGWHLPVNQGKFNFDEVQYLHFRDDSTAFEALKKGIVDVREEHDPSRWSSAYDFPAAKSGQVGKHLIPSGLSAGMFGLALNTRRPIFENKSVRKALIQLFDFEWINANLYNKLYQRTESFYSRSELSSNGKPASPFERELLGKFPDAVEPAILDGTFAMPKSDGRGRNRKNRRIARELLGEAGYEIKNGKAVSKADGSPLRFEIIVVRRSDERLFLTYARALQQAGIDAQIRLVDSSQFQARLANYDFDAVPYQWDASLSPGNEQIFYFGSQGRKLEGTRNYFGAGNKAVDAMIDAMLAARDRSEFVDAVRALDRILLSGHYVVPLFHRPGAWIALWSHIKRPKQTSLFGYRIENWWSEKQTGQ